MSDPKKPQITVTIDGQSHTVDLPDGYLAQAEVDAKYLPRETVNSLYVLQTEIDRRFKDWIKKEEAAKDQQVIAAVLEANPPKDRKPGDDDPVAAKAMWKQTELDPVLEENKSLKALILGNDITTGAGAFFAQQYVTSPIPGEQPYMQALFGKRFEYDPQLKYHVALDEQGNRIPAQKPTVQRPHADAKEFFGTLAGQEAYKQFLKPADVNNSSDFQGGDGGSPNGAKSPSQYKPRSQMSTDEKVAAIEELGRDKFMQIPLNAKP